jgi:antitoxin MazE
MEVELKKWGNSIGLRIPQPLAKSLNLDTKSIVELTQENDSLILKKKKASLTLDQLLESIPADFTYPDDVKDFINSKCQGEELI